MIAYDEDPKEEQDHEIDQTLDCKELFLNIVRE